MKIYKCPWVSRESYFVKTGTASTMTTSRTTTVGCGLPHHGFAVTKIPTLDARPWFALWTLVVGLAVLVHASAALSHRLVFSIQNF